MMPPNLGRMSLYTTSKTKIKIFADFRSDTVTMPTAQMLQFINEAPVGDDVFEEDESINLLQSRTAILAGKEAALFCASGTMANQVAIRSHLVQPPYSVLCDKESHVYVYEAGGISFHNGAQVIPVSTKGNYLTEEMVREHWIVDDDVHHCPTKLICLENTKNGQVFPLEEQYKISKAAKENGIRMHLDGARLWNASIATKHTMKDLCGPYDSVSLCFSKGLGAPVGSVLVGSREFIKKARHFRKLFGGGWRQAGILAAACLYCLDHHFPNLHNDHMNARYLSLELIRLGFVLSKPCETNMVWVDTNGYGMTPKQICSLLEPNGIRIFEGEGNSIRWVLHHQISREAIEKTIEILARNKPL
jgi:threonine aldolase